MTPKAPSWGHAGMHLVHVHCVLFITTRQTVIQEDGMVLLVRAPWPRSLTANLGGGVMSRKPLERPRGESLREGCFEPLSKTDAESAPKVLRCQTKWHAFGACSKFPSESYQATVPKRMFPRECQQAKSPTKLDRKPMSTDTKHSYLGSRWYAFSSCGVTPSWGHS